MASGAVSAAIEDYLKANWTTTLLSLENDSKATDGSVLPPVNSAGESIAFVAASFTGRTYQQVSLGASQQKDNRWDEEGILFLDVLVPNNTGSRDARTFAKSLCDLFRGLTLLSGSLEFRAASIGEGVKSDKYTGNYFSIPVDIDWRRVEA
jgi:hypothetical protein